MKKVEAGGTRRSPARRVLPMALLAALSAHAPADAQQARPDQQDPTPEELHQIACVVAQHAAIAAAMERGEGPLLVVSGREVGPVERPQRPCPEDPQLPRNATEFRYIRPHSAPELFGPRGKNGAILLDLQPRTRARAPGR